MSRNRKFQLGEDCTFAKLDEEAVQDIRSKHRQRLKLLQYIRDNLSLDAIAKHHKVAQSTVTCITSRRTWSHVA